MNDKPSVIREDLEAALEHMGTTLDITFDDLWKIVGLTLDQAQQRKTIFESKEWIRDIMKSPVITCTPGTTVHEVAGILLEKDIHCLPVVEDGTRLAGIVTESDLVYQFPAVSADAGAENPLKHLFRRKIVHRTGHTAGEIMTKEVVTVHPGDSIETAVHLMLRCGFGRLPVVLEDRTLVGIVARKDLLRYVR